MDGTWTGLRIPLSIAPMTLEDSTHYANTTELQIGNHTARRGSRPVSAEMQSGGCPTTNQWDDDRMTENARGVAINR